MNPKLVLSLWRERWGKTADSAIKLPYLRGKPNAWGYRLAHAGVWSLPMFVSGTFAASSVLLAWMLSIQFSQGGQLAFSFVLAGFAVYLRRYRGRLITLALFGMSLLVSGRYLYWRFTATLGQGINSDFVLGFGLCVAELHLWVLAVLGYIDRAWPLKRASIPLPVDQGTWPSVDVYITGHGRDLKSVSQSCADALALDWPREKLHVYLLDTEPRDNVRDLAASVGVTYLGYSDGSIDAADLVFVALGQTKGELVAILDGDRGPEKNFLQTSAGWFVRDRGLGMLRTPHHFLSTESVPGNQQLFPLTASTEVSCAIIRRSLVAECDTAKLEAATQHPQIARKWQMTGYGTGYLGFNDNPTQDSVIFRVDHRLHSASLIWRRRLTAARFMLQFYLPIPRLVFFTAPLAYLLAGVHLIQANVELLAAYALPHVLHAYYVRERLKGSKRLPFWADVCDTVLGWYMLLPTTITIVRTEITQFIAARSKNSAQPKEAFRWTDSLPYSIVLILNVCGIAVGILQPMLQAGSESSNSTLYLLWCTCNVMLLAATLAVAEESRHIRMQARKLSRMPAMLKLASGHALSCETENFPETTLSLSLPTRTGLVNGTEVNVSIFFGQQEFDFSAHVVSVQHAAVVVRIDDTALNRYRMAGTVVLTRGNDWPQWLPGRNADHPLPQWLSKPIGAALLRMKALLEKTAHTIGRSRLVRWIQKRKIQT